MQELTHGAGDHLVANLRSLFACICASYPFPSGCTSRSLQAAKGEYELAFLSSRLSFLNDFKRPSAMGPMQDNAGLCCRMAPAVTAVWALCLTVGLAWFPMFILTCNYVCVCVCVCGCVCACVCRCVRVGVGGCGCVWVCQWVYVLVFMSVCEGGLVGRNRLGYVVKSTI